MQVAAREGRPVIGEALEIVFADGRTRMIYGNAAPLFDEEGRPRGAIGAFMDVTEWRRVEAALADSEERTAPGRPGDRAGPLRPGPGQRDPAMVGAHQGDLRAPGRLPDHLRATSSR